MESPRPARPAFDRDELEALEALGVPPGAAGAPSGCPDPSLLVAVDAGVLDEAAAGGVRAHLRSCARCRQTAADLSTLFDEDPPGDSVADRLAARVPETVPGRRPRRAWTWLVPAGGLAAAALIWMAVATRPAPLPPASAPDRPAPPGLIASVFRPDRPSIGSGDVELTVRGAEAPPSLEARLTGALDLADAGNRPGALDRLATIAKAFPDESDAHLALGATLLADGQAAESIAPLERARALASGEAADEVDWFLAIACVQTGDVERGRTLARTVCDHRGPRSAVACAGVAELSKTTTPR
jgi:hypothetical protein